MESVLFDKEEWAVLDSCRSKDKAREVFQRLVVIDGMIYSTDGRMAVRVAPLDGQTFPKDGVYKVLSANKGQIFSGFGVILEEDMKHTFPDVKNVFPLKVQTDKRAVISRKKGEKEQDISILLAKICEDEFTFNYSFLERLAPVKDVWTYDVKKERRVLHIWTNRIECIVLGLKVSRRMGR